MKDFLGREIMVGDVIVYASADRYDDPLRKCHVIETVHGDRITAQWIEPWTKDVVASTFRKPDRIAILRSPGS